MAHEVPNINPNNGVEMPSIGLGVFQTPPDETRSAVSASLGIGYRHIDTGAEGQHTSTLEDPTMVKIADSHSESPAQVMLRWHLQRQPPAPWLQTATASLCWLVGSIASAGSLTNWATGPSPSKRTSPTAAAWSPQPTAFAKSSGPPTSW
jgi:hypothetical protein